MVRNKSQEQDIDDIIELTEIVEQGSLLPSEYVSKKGENTLSLEASSEHIEEQSDTQNDVPELDDLLADIHALRDRQTDNDLVPPSKTSKQEDTEFPELDDLISDLQPQKKPAEKPVENDPFADLDEAFANIATDLSQETKSKKQAKDNDLSSNDDPFADLDDMFANIGADLSQEAEVKQPTKDDTSSTDDDPFADLDEVLTRIPEEKLNVVQAASSKEDQKSPKNDDIDNLNEMNALIDALQPPSTPAESNTKALPPEDDVATMLDSLTDSLTTPTNASSGGPAISDDDLNDLVTSIERETQDREAQKHSSTTDVFDPKTEEANSLSLSAENSDIDVSDDGYQFVEDSDLGALFEDVDFLESTPPVVEKEKVVKPTPAQPSAKITPEQKIAKPTSTQTTNVGVVKSNEKNNVKTASKIVLTPKKTQKTSLSVNKKPEASVPTNETQTALLARIEQLETEVKTLRQAEGSQNPLHLVLTALQDKSSPLFNQLQSMLDNSAQKLVPDAIEGQTAELEGLRQSVQLFETALQPLESQVKKLDEKCKKLENIPAQTIDTETLFADLLPHLQNPMKQTAKDVAIHALQEKLPQALATMEERMVALESTIQKQLTSEMLLPLVQPLLQESVDKTVTSTVLRVCRQELETFSTTVPTMERLQALEARLNEEFSPEAPLMERIQGLESRLETLNEDLGEQLTPEVMLEGVATLENRLEVLSAKLDKKADSETLETELQSRVQEFIQTALQEQKEKQEGSLQAELSVLQNQTTEQANTLQTALTALQKQQAEQKDTFDAELSTLRAEMLHANTLDSVNEHLNVLTTRLDEQASIESVSDQLQSRVQELIQTTLQEYTEKQESPLQSELSILQERTAEQTSTLQTALTALQTQQTEQKDRLDAELSTLRNEMLYANALDSVNERLNTLMTALEQQRDTKAFIAELLPHMRESIDQAASASAARVLREELAALLKR